MFLLILEINTEKKFVVNCFFYVSQINVYIKVYMVDFWMGEVF